MNDQLARGAAADFGEMLIAVAAELVAYGEALKRDGPNAEWVWSTYGLEAQAAVYDLAKKDGAI